MNQNTRWNSEKW